MWMAFNNDQVLQLCTYQKAPNNVNSSITSHVIIIIIIHHNIPDVPLLGKSLGMPFPYQSTPCPYLQDNTFPEIVFIHFTH